MELNRRYIARRLREARGDHSQAEVAKKLGWSQSLVCKMESGAREPTAAEVWQLARLYVKPLVFFFVERKTRPAFVTEDLLSWHIVHYGYKRLVFRKEIKGDLLLSVEDVLLTVIQWLPSPRFLEALPVLLYLNNIDHDALYDGAWRENQQNRLGFIISAAIECLKGQGRKKKELFALNKRLESVKLAKEDSFLEDLDKLSVKSLEFLRATRPALAAEWNIVDRLFVNDFKEAFDNAILAKTS